MLLDLQVAVLVDSHVRISACDLQGRRGFLEYGRCSCSPKLVRAYHWQVPEVLVGLRVVQAASGRREGLRNQDARTPSAPTATLADLGLLCDGTSTTAGTSPRGVGQQHQDDSLVVHCCNLQAAPPRSASQGQAVVMLLLSTQWP